MTEYASLNVRLYGTDEPPAAARQMRAGALSMLFEDGALRRITLAGREAIRGIAFVVRDRDWGTCNPRITNLDIADADGAFSVHYDAACGDALTWSATITGAPDGTLEFVVTGRARSAFLTSRTGFVVLHPVRHLAGAPVTVTHTDGAVETAAFPLTISPSQPFKDIRALCHEAAPGVRVTCTMEGDAFEMEDQRNWTDASYKTYIRPLARPFPYTLEPGREFVQRVRIDANGRLPEPPRVANSGVTVSLGTADAGGLPVLALAVDPAHVLDARTAVRTIRESGVEWLVCRFDSAAGHDADTMALFRKLGDETGARLVLEAVLPLTDRTGNYTDDPAVLAADVATLRGAARRAGAEFAVVSGSPSCYLKSYQPAGPGPSAPRLSDVYARLRESFPGAQIAGGMHGYFTEFNRRPPPVEALDIVTHSTCPIVHAADDVSVMQTLEALPSVFATVRELAGPTPYWIGPTAIGMRFNPYGAAPAANPGNGRVAMATLDPRQRGLFNAAWTLGYIACAAEAGVAGLCLSAVAGPHAIRWQPADWPQPWFDRLAADAAVFPVFPVVAGLAGRTGTRLVAAESSDTTALAALALQGAAGTELWLANLTAAPLSITLVGPVGGPIGGPVGTARVQCLDADTFEGCCADPGGFAATARPMTSNRVDAGAYAVLRIAA
ncbi:MAG TPA: hypothetical protein VFY03_14570 [Woeseiaceae bacterium]|nr:hypothetical protein [Woeseiaceae bacterium]